MNAIRSTAVGAAALLLLGCATHSIGSADPSPAEDGVKAAEEAGRAAGPLLEMNHLYVALEQEDYEAVLESEFLGEQFCVLHEMTQTIESGPFTAIYLMGRKAYVELLGSHGPKEAQVGFAGVALSSQTVGDLEVVYERLRKDHGEAVTRELEAMPGEEQDIPLYWTVRMAGDWPSFYPWLMEDHPDRPADYLGVERDTAGFAPRSRQMVAYVAMMEPSASLGDVLFDDIIGIEVAASSSDADALAALLLASGFERAAGEDREQFEGPHCTIVVRRSEQPRYGITSIRFSLSRPVDQELQLELGGNLVLTMAPGSDQAELHIGGR